jgi:hypothetical protein
MELAIVRIFLAKSIKFFVALLLLPVFLPLVQALIRQGETLNERMIFFENPFSLSLGGVILWCLFSIFFSLPPRVYVFAHELTHALFIKLFGGSIRKISVKKDHGYVISDKTNFLITLAPYLFPFYAFLAGLLGITVSLATTGSTPLIPVWVTIGVCLGYHWDMTGRMLMTRQTDFSSQGYIFSFCLILLSNLLLIWLLMTLLPAPEKFAAKAEILWDSLIDSYKSVFYGIRKL